MDNKIYNKVVTELQDPDTLKIELEGYGLYTIKLYLLLKVQMCTMQFYRTDQRE